MKSRATKLAEVVLILLDALEDAQAYVTNLLRAGDGAQLSFGVDLAQRIVRQLGPALRDLYGRRSPGRNPLGPKVAFELTERLWSSLRQRALAARAAAEEAGALRSREATRLRKIAAALEADARRTARVVRDEMVRLGLWSPQSVRLLHLEEWLD